MTMKGMYNRISPAKKDPKQKIALSVPSVASRLRSGVKPAPSMVRKT